jgi:hypothetical protein
VTYEYRSAPLTAEQDGNPAVVVHCSDPRYQPHFQDFLRRGLKIDRYALVAVPGGAQCFTLAEYLPKFSWAGWRWMKFMVNLTRPSRIILIAHDDCRWYIENRFVHDPSVLRDRQIADLRRARAELADRFGPVPIEMFFATLSGDSAHFEQL